MLKMKCDEIASLLIELKEGSISVENKALVELHLATCAECSADLLLIGKAFDALRVSADEEVPTHYFTNLTLRRSLYLLCRNGCSA